jgi:hypothetical protein
MKDWELPNLNPSFSAMSDLEKFYYNQLRILHMMNLHISSLIKFKKDLADFIKDTK